MNARTLPVKLDHSAFISQPGKLEILVKFFTEILGWAVVKKTPVYDWGYSYFVCNGEDTLQLSDYTSFKGGQLPVHIGLDLTDPADMLQVIRDFAQGEGLRIEDIKAESLPGGKFMVVWPEIVPFSFEACPIN